MASSRSNRFNSDRAVHEEAVHHVSIVPGNGISKVVGKFGIAGASQNEEVPGNQAENVTIGLRDVLGRR